MNEDDLLISIGADLSAFNSAMATAEKAFANLRRATQSKPVKVTLESMVADLKKDQKAFQAYYKDAKSKFKGLTKAQIREFYEREQAYKASLKRQEAAMKANADKQVATTKETTAKIVSEQNKVAKHPSRNWDFAGHRGLIDSALVVAKYGIISQVLYGVQNAFGAVIGEAARFNQSVQQNIAVLEKLPANAKYLAQTVVEIGKEFGGTFEDIQDGLITIGRAGITETEQLAEATRGLAALSVITGDAMKYGASAVASLVAVYPELGNQLSRTTVEINGQTEAQAGLLDKMGAVANATRLGLEDFSTISNYALTTAHSVGLSSDAFLALSGSLSRVGLNASTIGTSIRRLDKFTSDSAISVRKFFAIAGTSQKEFAASLRDNPLTENIDESIVGLNNFTKALAKMTDAQFAEAVADLDIQMRATARSLRAVGELGELDYMVSKIRDAADVTESAKENAIGLQVAWQRIKNELISIADTEVQKTMDNLFSGEQLLDFIEMVVTLGQWLKNVIIIMKAVGNAIIIAWNAVAIYVGQKMNEIANIMMNFGAIAHNAWKAVYDFAASIITDLVNWFIDKLNSLISKINGLGGGLLKKIGIDILPTIDRVDDYKSSIEEAKITTKDYFDVAGDVKDLNKAWKDAGTNVEDLIKSNDTFGKVLDEINEKRKKYAEAGTGVEPKDLEKTAEEVALAERVKLQRQLLNKELSVEQYRRGKLRIEYQYELAKFNELKQLAKEKGKFSEEALKLPIQESKLLDVQIRQRQFEQGLIEKSAGTSKDRARALEREAQIRAILAEIEKTSNFDLQTRYEREKELLDIAHAKTIAAAEAYNDAVLSAKTEEDRLNLKRLELRLFKAVNAELKLQKKEAQRLAGEFAKAADTFADSLLGGDITGAFKKLLKDITKVFTDPLKDSFTTLFGNTMKKLLGGFYDDYVGKLSEWSKTGTEAAQKVGLENAKASVANAGAGGDPYTAFARIAAMAAAMAAIGYAIGGIGGSTGEMSAAEEAKFAGTSASEFTDESLTNLLSAFEEVQYPLLEVTNKMYRHIRNMDDNFYSIARAIASTASAAGGIDITGGSFNEGIYAGNLYSTKTKELLGAGLKFTDQSLQALSDIQTIAVQGYEAIKTVKEYWWKTSVTYAEVPFDLPPEVIKSFANTFAEGYEQILTAGTLLGLDQADLERALNEATISLGENGKINLEGLDQEGVADALNSIFGTAFSQVVNQIDAFDELITRYARGAEQSIETLSRIAIEYDQASFAFGLIGKEFSDVIKGTSEIWTETLIEEISNSENVISDGFVGIFGSIFNSTGFIGNMSNIFSGAATAVTTAVTEILKQTVVDVYTVQEQILDIVESTGGITEFQDAMGAFMTNFYSESEQLEFMQKTLAASFKTLGIEAPKTNEEFRNLLETMDTSTEEGAYLYGQVLLLSESFAAMTNAAENLNEAMDIGPIQAIADAWLSDLSYLTNAQKTAFADSYYDIVRDFAAINEDVSLVDAARSAAEQALKTSATREEFIPYFDRYIRALEDEAEEATLNDVVIELREVVSAIRELEDTTIRIQPVQ